MNIFVGIMAAIVFGAGIWGWWLENEGNKRNKEEETENTMLEEQKKG